MTEGVGPSTGERGPSSRQEAPLHPFLLRPRPNKFMERPVMFIIEDYYGLFEWTILPPVAFLLDDIGTLVTAIPNYAFLNVSKTVPSLFNPDIGKNKEVEGKGACKTDSKIPTSQTSIRRWSDQQQIAIRK